MPIATETKTQRFLSGENTSVFKLFFFPRPIRRSVDQTNQRITFHGTVATIQIDEESCMVKSNVDSPLSVAIHDSSRLSLSTKPTTNFTLTSQGETIRTYVSRDHTITVRPPRETKKPILFILSQEKRERRR